MDRRLLIIGAILLLAGLVMVFGSSQATLAALPNENSTNTQRAYIPANTVAYYPITLVSVSFVGIGYNATTPVSFYLVNSSAYNAMLPAIHDNESLKNISISLEGKGVVAAQWDSAKGIFPWQASYSGIFPPPNYSEENVTLLPNDTYFILFQSGSTSNSTLIAYSIITTPASDLGISSFAAAGFGVVGAFLVLAGLALCVYALIRKGDDPETLREKEVDRIFADIEKKKRPRKKSRYRTVVRRKGST
jgi:hypothetical protein